MKKLINLQMKTLVLVTVFMAGCTLATNGLRPATQHGQVSSAAPATYTHADKH